MAHSPEFEQFRLEVYNIVSQIPKGYVLTYGRIAELAGWPRHSRLVGRALKLSPKDKPLPCHRVVNSQGRTAPGWTEQQELLAGEGVAFRKSGYVDLRKCLWHPERENY
ncbi:MAG: MGMT family protein [Prevotella sp.]